MASINDAAMDAGLNQIKNANRIVLCNAEPTTYAEANTGMLAHRDTPSFSANENGTSGRQFRVAAITDGVGDAAGTANYWALVNTSTQTLWATGDLAAAVAIAVGATVSIGEATVRLNDPS